MHLKFKWSTNKNVALSIVLTSLIFLMYHLNESNQSDHIINLVNRIYTEKNILKYDYLKRYPTFLDCRKKEGLNKWHPNSKKLMSNLNKDYMVANNSSTEFHDQAYLRAIILYFPYEMAKQFTPEFKWFFRTWIEIHLSEPKKWRTDLVVFIENNSTFFQSVQSKFFEELNCTFTNRRVSKSDKPMCTLIDYKALSARKFPVLKNLNLTRDGIKWNKERYKYLLDKVDIFSEGSDNLLPFYSLAQSALSKYNYVDSILMAFDGYDYFKSAGFDFLMRSDMDVFLSPSFGKWIPKHCNDFIVGQGGYSHDFNRKRLERVSNNLGLEYAHASNLGSTWYSTPEQFRLVSYLTVFSMTYLANEEFTLPERNQEIGTINWPYWHWGVLLLYGQNIALNHLIGSHQANIVNLGHLFDYPSANVELISSKLHIHVFHGDDMFSKFAFKSRQYDNMTVKESDADKVRYYCLKMALESKRKNSSELNDMLDRQALLKT